MALGAKEWRTEREFQRGARAFDQDRLLDAKGHLQRYLQARPDNAAAHLLAARVHRLLGSFRDAEQHLNQCKRLGGMSGDLQMEWLLLRAMNGEFPAVEKDLRQLVADHDPRSNLILEALSHCHIGVLRYHSAHDLLNNWLSMEPDNIRALDLRAYVWERMEARERALEDYNRVLELSPATRHARVSLVELFLGQRNIDDAAEHLKILKQNPQHEPGELLLFARFAALQGNTQEALRLLDACLTKQPDHADALCERGKLTEDVIEAETYFRKALEGRENLVQARHHLYVALRKQGRTQEAEEEQARYKSTLKDLGVLEKLLVQADQLANPDLLADCAAILIRGNSHQGTQMLFRALHLNHNHKRSHEMLADYYEKSQQSGKAAYHRRLAAVKSP